MPALNIPEDPYIELGPIRPYYQFNTDVYTYSNFISLANQLGIQLIWATADHEGMLPENLEKQCKLMDIKGISDAVIS